MLFFLVMVQAACWRFCLSQSYQGGNPVTSSPTTTGSTTSPTTSSTGTVTTTAQLSSTTTATTLTSTTTSPVSTTTATPGTTTTPSLTSATPLTSCCTAGTICITLDGNSCFSQNEASCKTLGKISPNDADSITVDITARNRTLLGQWVAVGFSTSGGMSGSAVVHCILPDNGTAFGKLTYNPDHFNTGWSNIDQSPLTFTTAVFSDGVLHCTGILKKVFRVPTDIGLGFNPFDVKNVQLSLIMATGPFSSGEIGYHGRGGGRAFGTAQFP